MTDYPHFCTDCNEGRAQLSDDGRCTMCNGARVITHASQPKPHIVLDRLTLSELDIARLCGGGRRR